MYTLTTTLLASDLALRKMTLADLADIRDTEAQWMGSFNPGEKIATAVVAGTATGQVATIQGETVGFIVYRVTYQRRVADVSTLKKLLALCFDWRHRQHRSKMLQIELLNITVMPAWRRQ